MRAYWLLGARVVNALGGGLVIPFVIVYLRDARHFPIWMASVVVSVASTAAVPGGLLCGAVIDRASATVAAALAFGIATIGCVLYAFATDLPLALLAGATLGTGIGGSGAVWNSLIGESVPPEARTTAFGLSFASVNAGIGAGGLLGGVIASWSPPRGFQLLFLGDAAGLVACAFLVALVGRSVVRQAPAPAVSRPGPLRRRSYRRVFLDGLFGPVLLLITMLSVFGYGQLEAALPAYATRPGGIDVRSLAVVFACNTFSVIGLQLLVLRRMTTMRRTTALTLTCVAWAVTWSLVLAAGLGGRSWLALLGFVLAAFVFAVGEVLLAPTLPALANELAPEGARGRYNAAASLAITLGMVVGPLLAGAALQAGQPTVLFTALTVGCCLVGLAWQGMAKAAPEALNGPAASSRS